MIRKEGKARWVYRCEFCEVVETTVDQFRAIEAKQAHEKTPTHAGNGMVSAFTVLADALSSAIRPFADLAEQLNAAPPNRPHDPALLNDKRKWGGK